MPRRRSKYLSGRGFSLYMDINDGLSDFYTKYPEVSIETIKKTTEDAMDQTWSITPMKTGQLRENTRVIAFQKGQLGGTVYAQWLAQNPKDGFHYAITQEQGGHGEYIYVDYTTPGTHEGFIKETWDIIKKNALEDLQDATNKLIHEVSV